MELGTGYIIHDNLTLNIINLIHPFSVITRWKSGSQEKKKNLRTSRRGWRSGT